MRDLVDPMSFAVFTLAGCSMPGTGYRIRRVPDVRWESPTEPRAEDSATPVARTPSSPSDGRSLD